MQNFQVVCCRFVVCWKGFKIFSNIILINKATRLVDRFRSRFKWTLFKPRHALSALTRSDKQTICSRRLQKHLKNWKHCGKRRNCAFWAISTFVAMFSKVICCRCVRKRLYVGKGLTVSKLQTYFNAFEADNFLHNVNLITICSFIDIFHIFA